jgi:hypothetical protein
MIESKAVADEVTGLHLHTRHCLVFHSYPGQGWRVDG